MKWNHCFACCYLFSYAKLVPWVVVVMLGAKDPSLSKLLRREEQGPQERKVNESVLPFILQDLYRPLSSDDLDSVGDSV